MTLLQSWKDSLSIFKPHNFKQFLVATFESIKETYVVWIKYWWWLIALLLVWQYYVSLDSIPVLFTQGLFSVFDIKYFIQDEPEKIIPFWVLPIIGKILLLIVFSTLVLSARSTTEKKNYRYFFRFWPHLFYLLLWVVLLAFIKYPLLEMIQEPFRRMWSYGTMGELIWGIFFVVIWPTILFFINLFFVAFLFDSNGSFRVVLQSIWNAIKMFVYNLPGFLLFMLILGIVFGLLVLPLLLLQSLVTHLLNILFWDLLITPIIFNFVLNFYYNRRNAQKELYGR